MTQKATNNPSGNEPLTDEAFDAAVSFDPFAQMDAGPDVDPAPAPAEPAPNEPPPAAAPSPEPGSTPAPSAPDSEVTRLQAANAEKDRVIAELSRGAAPAAPKTGEEPKGDPLDSLYNLSAPAQLMQMMYSEDPNERAQGLAHFMNGLARTVHKGVMSAVDPRFNSVGNQINTAIRQYQQQEEVRRDFYGTYTVLDKPEYRQWIIGLGAQVMREKNTQTWSAEIRDEIADRVAGVWKVKREDLTGRAPAAPPTPKPPADLSPGTRPGAGPGAQSADPNSPQAVMDSLFG